MAVRSPQDIYARHLSSSRGYPMWTPEPSSQLLVRRPEGLRIGDVGVVTPKNGNFDVFFNICLPKDHRFHQAGGVPDGFNHIELDETDIQTVSNVERSGHVLAGSSVMRVDGDAKPGANNTGATRYTFNLSSDEGALLVLPLGADRHDVRDNRRFLEQASRHAASWYRFAEENLGRIISHDSIYVITGFHKARSWGLAGYENDQGDGAFPAHFIVGAREGSGDLAASYTWQATRSMDWRVSPSDGLGIPNQSVFIRGFKIALRSDLQGVPQRWINYVPSRPDVRSNDGNSNSLLANIWRGVFKTLGMSNNGADQAEDERVRVEVSRMPEISPVFHPSDVINKHILQREPTANVAITHDSDWGLIVERNLLTPEELVRGELLTKAVDGIYTIVSTDGVAHLESKNGLGTLTDAAVAAAPVLPTSLGETRDEIQEEKKHDISEPCHPECLSVVSESNYRCVDEHATKSITAESCPGDLHSIPSKFKFGAPRIDAEEHHRPIKIIVISDYICGFCYICNKVLRDAIEACQDLPLRFDVEFRPFNLVKSSGLLTPTPKQAVYRNAYVVKRFGKEQAEIKLKALGDLAQKAGLKFAEDSIICMTTQAHRLSTKAYRDGGQELQNKFNEYIFDACLAKGGNLDDEDFLVDAAVNTGLMNEDEAIEFLQSAEFLDCVQKMVEAARAQGITGVPFVIIDGKWAVNGLQPKECFIQIFRKLAQFPATQTVSGKSKVEQEVGGH